MIVRTIASLYNARETAENSKALLRFRDQGEGQVLRTCMIEETPREQRSEP